MSHKTKWERLRLLEYSLYSAVHVSQSYSSNTQTGTEVPPLGQLEFWGEGRSEAATVSHNPPVTKLVIRNNIEKALFPH